MGYYVRKLPHKNSPPHWKVQFVSYKNNDIKEKFHCKKPKKEWDIPTTRWRMLGFSSSMTLADAKSRANQLNKQMHLKKQEERVKQIELIRAENIFKRQAQLPIEFVVEFESRFLRGRKFNKDDINIRASINEKKYLTQAYRLWNAAQRFIVAIQIDPSDWFYFTQEIYDYFHSKKYSIRYIHSILRFANLCGFFISKKLAKPFLPISVPRGYEKARLLDAFYEKCAHEGRIKLASKPLTPKHLIIINGKINQLTFNWIFLTVWLGLRPQEVDNLHNNNNWHIEKLPTGRKILWVYQTKIVALPPEDRWKPIPILYEEQMFALKIIESKKFKRPLPKTFRRHFGREINSYGGRKGFVDLMLSKGHTLENISIWMGHTSLMRTWRSYKNKRQYHL